jgi:hypothetical protein
MGAMRNRGDVAVEPEYYPKGIEVFCPDCRHVLSKGPLDDMRDDLE